MKLFRHILPGLTAVAIAGGVAWAAQTTITFVIPAPQVTATAITCSPVAIPPTPASGGTLAAGFKICPLTVAPSNWVGTLTISNAAGNAADFTVATINGVPTLETAVALSAGSYPVTIVATP